jgi:hypothetical protein
MGRGFLGPQSTTPGLPVAEAADDMISSRTTGRSRTRSAPRPRSLGAAVAAEGRAGDGSRAGPPEAIAAPSIGRRSPPCVELHRFGTEHAHPGSAATWFRRSRTDGRTRNVSDLAPALRPPSRRAPATANTDGAATPPSASIRRARRPAPAHKCTTRSSALIIVARTAARHRRDLSVEAVAAAPGRRRPARCQTLLAPDGPDARRPRAGARTGPAGQYGKLLRAMSQSAGFPRCAVPPAPYRFDSLDDHAANGIKRAARLRHRRHAVFPSCASIKVRRIRQRPVRAVEGTQRRFSTVSCAGRST